MTVGRRDRADLESSAVPGCLTEAGAYAVVAGAGAATVGRLLRPRRPDPAEQPVRDAGLPPAEASVRLRPLVHSTWRAPAPLIAEGDFRAPRGLPMAFVTWVAHHPRATFLIDPAVSSSGSSSAQALSAVGRRILAPPRATRGLGELLEENDVAPDSIDFAVATHLHFDHVDGLLDLPDLTLRFARPELDPPPNRPRRLLGAPTAPWLPGRIDPLDLTGPPLATFDASHDLLQDGSVLVVALPGHTPGSVGYLVHVGEGRRILLAGDAVWAARQIRRQRQKAPLPGWMVDHDRTRTFATIRRLHALSSDITVVPAHDAAASSSIAGH